jgi:peptidyl-prolyl cis-trans isomerase C
LTRRFALLPLAVALSLACSRPPAQARAETSSATPPAQTAQPAPEPRPPAPAAAALEAPPKPVPAELPAVVARVNGEDIPRAELMRAIESVEAQAGGPVPPDRRDEIFRGILDQLVAYHVLAQESKARKFAVNEAEVEARIAAIRKQFSDEEAFKRALAQRNLTAEELRADARIDLAISRMLETEIASKLTVPAKDVADYYAQNPDQFEQPESVRASHILLRVPENADEATKTKVRAEAEDVLRKAQSGGDFAVLAREHSQDPGSAAGGGELGFFPRGQMVAPFEAAAFALQTGAISDVVETPFGFHIIKLHERRSARTVPFEEVSGQIEGFLLDRARRQETEAFVLRLKAKSKIEILI